MDIEFKKIWEYVVQKSQKRYDVYIGRPSRWGNPFSSKEGTLAEFKVQTREESIQKHQDWVLSQPQMIEDIKRELRGKVLGCFCSPKRCHGHTLAWIANYYEEEDDKD